MMRNEDLVTIIDYVCEIDSLVCTVRDSCELNMYATQQGTLEIVCKYLIELNEYLSKL